MKVSLFFDTIEINLRTDDKGGSSCLQCCDLDTEVFYGNLHAKVKLKDMGLEIEMDSEPGEWKNPKWARAYALKSLQENITVEGLFEIIGLIRASAFQSGKEDAKKELRVFLGIEQERHYSEPSFE